MQTFVRYLCVYVCMHQACFPDRRQQLLYQSEDTQTASTLLSHLWARAHREETEGNKRQGHRQIRMKKWSCRKKEERRERSGMRFIQGRRHRQVGEKWNKKRCYVSYLRYFSSSNFPRGWKDQKTYNLSSRLSSFHLSLYTEMKTRLLWQILDKVKTKTTKGKAHENKN